MQPDAVERSGYRIGVPEGGDWTELLNSDAAPYGGHGRGNLGTVRADAVPIHGRHHSIDLTLPPLSVIVFERAPSNHVRSRETG